MYYVPTSLLAYLTTVSSLYYAHNLTLFKRNFQQISKLKIEIEGNIAG